MREWRATRHFVLLTVSFEFSYTLITNIESVKHSDGRDSLRNGVIVFSCSSKTVSCEKTCQSLFDSQARVSHCTCFFFFTDVLLVCRTFLSRAACSFSMAFAINIMLHRAYALSLFLSEFLRFDLDQNKNTRRYKCHKNHSGSRKNEAWESCGPFSNSPIFGHLVPSFD